MPEKTKKTCHCTECNRGPRRSLFIAPDDLELGMYVSIVTKPGKKRQRKHMIEGPGGETFHVRISEERDTRAGIPHKVLGISWPNIVLSTLYPGGAEGGLVILNFCNIRLMKLADNYVEAIRSFVDETEQSNELDQELIPISKMDTNHE